MNGDVSSVSTKHLQGWRLGRGVKKKDESSMKKKDGEPKKGGAINCTH